VSLAFDSNDYLPSGRHEATASEIKAALVDDFPKSATRSHLYDQWQALREAIERVIPIEEQWLDGSFVTRKEDPGDIDLVSHLDGSAVDNLSVADGMLLFGLLDRDLSRDVHGCHSFPIVIYPDGHPDRPQYEAALQAFDSLFGHDRNGNQKGYVEVVSE